MAAKRQHPTGGVGSNQYQTRGRPRSAATPARVGSFGSTATALAEPDTCAWTAAEHAGLHGERLATLQARAMEHGLEYALNATASIDERARWSRSIIHTAHRDGFSPDDEMALIVAAMSVEQQRRAEGVVYEPKEAREILRAVGISDAAMEQTARLGQPTLGSMTVLEKFRQGKLAIAGATGEAYGSLTPEHNQGHAIPVIPGEDRTRHVTDLIAAVGPRYATLEPWCNHDPAGVSRGRCECGKRMR